MKRFEQYPPPRPDRVGARGSGGPAGAEGGQQLGLVAVEPGGPQAEPDHYRQKLSAERGSQAGGPNGRRYVGCSKEHDRPRRVQRSRNDEAP